MIVVITIPQLSCPKTIDDINFDVIGEKYLHTKNVQFIA